MRISCVSGTSYTDILQGTLVSRGFGYSLPPFNPLLLAASHAQDSQYSPLDAQLLSAFQSSFWKHTVLADQAPELPLTP